MGNSIKYYVVSIKGFIALFLYFILYTLYFIPTAHAIVDPLAVPNNKFGIHIIQATPDESSPAASLVNSTGGDWGYITVLIEARDKKIDKWQEFFNDLRRRHLIPLVRLATIPEPGGFWKVPDEGEALVWADFLDSLNWPTKNRYVIIYNEPNHSNEWGKKVDAASYAKVLDQTIDALKKKSDEFFVLNAGLDASTPHQPPLYEEQVTFMQQMDSAVPGIFNKLDGWVSHSYPNPGFVGSPDAFGRGTVRTYLWELQQLRNLGVTKSLPVFITETGWQQTEGRHNGDQIHHIPYNPTSETVAQYYENAFENAWNPNFIVAVTPFLLTYQEPPFDHFSFKKAANEYHPQFHKIQSLSKLKGVPVQKNLAKLLKGEVYSSVVAGESYQITLNFKNTGQSIWEEGVILKATQGGGELGIKEVEIPKGIKIEPNQEYTFPLQIKAPLSGKYKVALNFFNGDKIFDSKPVEFETEVKSPVILQVNTKLKWKQDYSGEYLLKVSGPNQSSSIVLNLGPTGISEKLEFRHLLPDYEVEFSLERKNQTLTTHKPKKIRQRLQSGINTLDFGDLQPALLANLIHPRTLWSVLPFSNN